MTQYQVKLSVNLKPIWHSTAPEIRLGVPGNINTISLENTTEFEFDYYSNNISYFFIELLNKNLGDTIPEKKLDKAVVIESIKFFGIEDPRFIWSGVYTPIYPEHWVEENQQRGTPLPLQIVNNNYIGFNGIWRLDFTVPVFTWIHKIRSLGWIYD